MTCGYAEIRSSYSQASDWNELCNVEYEVIWRGRRNMISEAEARVEILIERRGMGALWLAAS